MSFFKTETIVRNLLNSNLQYNKRRIDTVYSKLGIKLQISWSTMNHQTKISCPVNALSFSPSSRIADDAASVKGKVRRLSRDTASPYGGPTLA